MGLPVILQKSMSWCLVSGFGIWVVTGIASAQGCDLDLDGLKETRKGTMAAIASRFECLSTRLQNVQGEKAAIVEQNRLLSEQNTLLQDQLSSVGAVIPAGTVVAFDRDAQTSGTCPDGWGEWLEGRGKMIVGAGDPAEAPAKFAFDERGKPLKHYVRGQHGGANDHVLMIKEMPSHDHGLKYALSGQRLPWISAQNSHPVPTNDGGSVDSYNWTDGGGNDGWTDGGSVDSRTAPHNNMPPFIALFYCKKLLF